jgi:hypothetical protein
MRLFVAEILPILLLASLAQAEEKSPKPLALDEDRRSAFSTRNEVFVYSGFYFGKTLDNSFVVGTEYLFRITHVWALGPSFTYTKAETANSVQLSQPGFFKSDHIYTTDLAVMIAMPAAFAAGDSVVQANLYSILGVGAIGINDAWHPHGFIGGGMKIFPGLDWMAIRVDIRTGLHPINTPSGEKFDQNLSLMVGLSFLIPPQVGQRGAGQPDP